MVTVVEVRRLAERLSKAEALVSAGAVFPVDGLPGYSVVRNGSGDSMYLVRHDVGHEHCTCKDYETRQGPAGMPCKHLLAAQIAASQPKPTEPAPAKRAKKVETVAVVEDARPVVNGAAALARLQGEDDTWKVAA